jgi:hypothetical protein
MLLKRIATVDFDPAIKAHRVAIRAFLKRRAWGDSPLRFTHDPAFGSVADQVCAKLLEWYVHREEFGVQRGPTQLALNFSEGEK